MRAFALLALACGACDTAPPRTGADGVATVADTIGDTIVARTTGEVGAERMRRLTVEWQTSAWPVPRSADSASFGGINDIAIGLGDRVYVWDGRTPALTLFAPDGAFVRQIGRKGSGPGEYGNLNGIAALWDGRLVVWDATNGRMNVYTPGGELFATWSSPILNFGTNDALAADDASRVWLRAFVRSTDPAQGALGRTAWFRIDSGGRVVDTVLAPVAHNDPELVARRGGSMSSYSLPYGRYAVAAVSPLGFLLWGPSDPYVVHAMSGTRPLRIERTWTPVPVSDAERAERRAITEWGLRLTDPAWTWQGPPVPSTKPAYESIRVGLDGRMWVSLHGPSRPVDPPPPRTGQQNPPPSLHFADGDQRWDVFEPNGAYLGRVEIPGTVEIRVMRGDAVWGVSSVDDVPALTKWRVTPGFIAR